MRRITTAALLSLALAACGQGLVGPAAGSGASGAPATPEKARIGVLSTLNFADIWVGVEKGIFAQAGITAEVVTFQSGDALRDALITGQIDLSPQSTSTVMVARNQNVPLKAVAARRTRQSFTLSVQSSLKSTVKSVADLKGRSIGVSALGSETAGLAAYFAKKAGLDPEKDVKLVAVGANGYAAMKTNRVDATVDRPPTDVRLVQENSAFLLVDPNDPAQHTQWFGDEDLSQSWLVTEDLIAKRPEVVRRLVQANDLILAFLNSGKADPQPVADVLRSHYDLEPALLVASVREALKSIAPDSKLGRKAYENDLKVWTDSGIVKAPVPFADAVDVRFAGERP